MKTYIYIFSIIMALYSWNAKAQGGDSLVGVQHEQNLLPLLQFNYDSALAAPGPLNTNEPPKGVFFVHGLGGDISSLSMLFDDITSTFYVKGLKIDYSSSATSMNGAKNHIQSPFEGENTNWATNYDMTDPSRNIVIAHSQGGLVSRHYSREIQQNPSQNGQTFGALITLNSPHSGAKILNHIDYILKLAEIGCIALLEGPKRELITTHFIVKLFGFDNTIDNIHADLCNYLGNELLPNLAKDFQDPITTEYHDGAQWIADLNNFQDNFPQIAFYGTESEPVFFRTTHWLTAEPNDYQPYQATEDLEFSSLEDAYMTYSKYKANKDYWQWRADMSIWQSYTTYLPWLNRKNRKEAKEIADGYELGEQYIRNLNPWWKIIIGQREFSLQTSTLHYCECYDSDEFGNFNWIEFVEANEPCSDDQLCEGPTAYTSVKVVWEDGQSDGVATAASQTGNPNAIHNIHLPGTSHMQVRNGKELEEKLKIRTLKNGQYGQWFQLEE